MWSTYHLSDGTRLKMRAILVNAYLLLKPGSTLKLVFDSVSTVAVPEHPRGTPSKTPHPKKVKKETVEVTDRIEPWNSY